MTRGGLLFLVLFWSGFLPAQDRPVYDESIESERKFSMFGGPTREGPEAEWARVEKAVEDGKLKRAIKYTAYLVKAWPDHPRAVDAQRMQGDLYFAREQYQKSFDAYQSLIDGFAGRFDYEAVLRMQLEAARKLENQTYHAFFGLSSYQQPDQAIPLYRQLLTNAPRMAEAPRILHAIGEIYFREEDYMEAVREFRLLEQRYPSHPLSEEGVLRMADAYASQADRNPTDIRPREGELDTLTYFVRRFPDSERLEAARIRRKTAYDKLAGIRYGQARFYEKNLRRPQAAVEVYQSLLQQFPDSEWTAPARERILDLTEKEL